MRSMMRVALLLTPALSACFVDRARYVAGNSDAAMEASASDGGLEASSEGGASSDGGAEASVEDAGAVRTPRVLSPLSTTNVSTRNFVVAVDADGVFNVEFNRSSNFMGESGGVLMGRGTGRVANPFQFSSRVTSAVGTWFFRACAAPPNHAQCSPTWSINVLSDSMTPTRNGFGIASDVLGTAHGDLLVTSRTPPMTHLSRTFFYSTVATSMTPSATGFVDECTQVLGVPAMMCSTFNDGLLLVQSVAMLGDTDGDGRAEAALYGEQGSASMLGTVAIVGGRSAMPAYFGRITANAAVRFLGGLSSAGDFNGDGLADLAVVVQSAMGARRVDVFLAGSGAVPFALDRRVILPVPAGGSIPAPTLVTAAGDINGDGYADLAVRGQNDSDGSGEVWLYTGSANPAASPPTPVRITGGSRVNFAASIAGGGDIDADGIADLYVAHGSLSGPADAMNLAMITGSRESMPVVTEVLSTVRNGAMVAMRAIATANDVNGDGLIDAVLVDDATSARTIEVVARVTVGASVTPQLLGPSINAPNMSDRFSPRIVARDVDGDGRAEIVVPLRVGGVGEAGPIHVYALPPMLTMPRLLATINNPDPATIQFGISAL
ncbi:MAG: VCBS repeat-containing protein [Polyangiales bacterium]